ncbi:tetratricopeptide repeat protein [Flavobacterium sp. N1736]|uniref:tetratricopeptide repeat protein n=1 Tax=Flavobacterium sp. N1736 TaxID=2986823 RepID=UPI00222422DD|nr:tetratricopeptide repeat protein [Flavobacterium sp. N1736]
MRYIPNLIPEKSKVLPHYFIENIILKKKSNPFLFFLKWFIGILFLLFALLYLKHPIISLIFGFIGFIILPFGHNWLEKKFRFSLTTKIKSVFVCVVLLFFLPLLGHYNSVDKKEAYLLKLKLEKEGKERAEFERFEKIRNDSLTYYITASSQFADKHQTDKALKELKIAGLFSKLPADADRITLEENKISAIKTFDLVKAGKYKLAIPQLDTLISKEGNNPNLFYNRAFCFSKTGKIKEAVDDCLQAMQLGDKKADKLYNSINPIKKRVAYYVTRCCDGSTSGSSGRGTCSHHGGVCNWREPVYEEYRKYE